MIFEETKKKLKILESQQKACYERKILDSIILAKNSSEFWGGINYFNKKNNNSIDNSSLASWFLYMDKELSLIDEIRYALNKFK